MKNLSIKTILLSIALLTYTLQHKAADLLVASGGAGGAYSTLAAAIAAANANDRIIVFPQANGASYAEGTLTITKSLQIVSATEGAYYTIDGTINVTPATAGINLSIVGMRLLTGNIQSTIASPTGARSNINLLHDSIGNGMVSFNHDNYNLTCASNYIQDGVTFRFGKILGNILRNQVTVNTDASVNNPNDTVQIIGNKITFYSGSNVGAISWYSTSQFYSIQNNFIYVTYPSNSINYGIHGTTSKTSSTGGNVIYNNTIYKPTYTIAYGIVITTVANSFTDAQNNLLVSGGIYQYAFYFAGGTFSTHYNYATTYNWYGPTNDGTNIQATNTTVNAEGVITNVLSNTLNGGNPDAAFDDIDLTRNDVGCYGGSYTLTNFHPFTSTDWARVILVTTPRRVLINTPVSVKAIGFDK